MISIIVAVAKENAIGRKGELLWHLSEDLKYFKATTMGHPVIMGRTTFESIGRPLPGRENVVIDFSEFDLPQTKPGSNTSIRVETNLNEFLTSCKESDTEWFVVGGGSIYRAAMEFADRLYITHINAEAHGADTFFPTIDPNKWRVVKESALQHDDENNLDFVFKVYERG